MTVTFQVSGLKELSRALGADIQKAARIAGFAAAQQIKQAVAPYPGRTEANQPKQWQSSAGGRRVRNTWYERTYGPRWVRKDGSIRGRKTSEMLGNSWAVKRHRLGGEVGNKASYSPAVHHYKEQAKFHGRRGWVTDKQAVARVQKSGIVDRIVKRAIDRALKGKAK